MDTSKISNICSVVTQTSLLHPQSLYVEGYTVVEDCDHIDKLRTRKLFYALTLELVL